MKRVRLTQRTAADGSIPYPGNVNQPGRTDPAWDQYHTFEQQVNHELPDMRTEWKNDSRDDIGFGIPEANAPTVASVRIAANKAVRIAVLLLGEKVADSVIEAQARDLMALNSEAMDRTLDRFAKTQKLYAGDDEDADDEKEAKSKKSADEDEKPEEKKASASLADKGGAVPPAISLEKTQVKAEKEEEKPAEVKAEDKVEEKVEAKTQKAEDKVEEKVEAKKAEKEEDKVEAKKAEDKAEDKVEAKKAEDKEEDKVEARLAKLETMIASIAAAVQPKVAAEEKKMPDFIQKKIDEKAEKDEKKAADEVKEEEKKAADEKDEKVEAKTKKSDDDADEDDKVEASAHKAGPNEMDIELTGSMDEVMASDPAADAQLASLFDDGITAAADEKEEEKTAKVKTAKAGIKKLGGQPKVAAQVVASADISNIWESAPDVSELFK
jgi:hypothetical protein